MPGRWEMNYLATDLDWENGPVIDSDEEYFGQFEPADGHDRIGEKSAFYLYSSVAAERIAEINPDAKIICMLRDPVELLWSMHRYNVQNLEEDIIPFSEALAAEEDRRQGRRIPETTTIIQNLYYRKIVRFPRQIKRYFDTFGRDQVHTVFFEDFASQTSREYRKVLSFLDLSPHTPETFEAENQGQKRGFYALTLRRWLLQWPLLKRATDTLVPEKLRDQIARIWNNLRGGVDSRLTQMDPALRLSLKREMTPMILSLEDVIGRDLSHWRHEEDLTTNASE
ncbi:hypothetical protein GGP53_003179 [Salinibacter ruber]|nr:hypothetical protein [Salinibacter ruber]MCS4146207.1 hypothetical protein [Salinibacter ruber]